MDIRAESRVFPFGTRAFVANSGSDKAYLIDAMTLADHVLPRLGPDVLPPGGQEPDPTLHWYLSRASAVRFADIDDDDGAARADFAATQSMHSPLAQPRHLAQLDESDKSILELLQIGTSRSAWVAHNWPDSAPESFSMSFGRAFRYVVTTPATEFGSSSRGLWIVTEDGPAHVSDVPAWAATLPTVGTSLQIDLCADLELYAHRYRHEFALQTLLVEAGRIAGDLISGAVQSGWNVLTGYLIGEPIWDGWFDTHAVVEMARFELRKTP
ncbi:hypothetical protein [Microbacterium paulum]